MRKIFSLAGVTFLQGVRSRVFYTLLFFGALLVAGTVVLNQMAVGDPTKIIQDLGLAALSVFSLLIIIFVGSQILTRDLESQAIYLILSKPINRGQYLLGRYLGLLAILYVNMAVFSAIILFILSLYTHALKWSLLLSAGFTALEMAILLAFLVFFFTFISAALAPFLVLAVFVIGHTTTEVRSIFAHKQGFYHLFSRVFYYLFPNFDLLNIQTEVVHNVPIPAMHVVYGAAYSLTVILLVFIASCLIFRTRDF